MKLFLSFTSPYARKARIVVREHNLESRVEEVATDYRQRPGDLLAANPTGKIPALVTEFGAIFDSPVICEYLDTLGTESLFPKAPQLWLDKTRVALGDALMDAAVALMLEGRREPPERSAAFMARERSRIEHCLSECTAGAAESARPTMGDISIVSALAYLDLRHPDIEWRSLAPQLHTWRDLVETRPSFVATRLG
jgi:glutathione S-transferase